MLTQRCLDVHTTLLMHLKVPTNEQLRQCCDNTATILECLLRSEFECPGELLSDLRETHPVWNKTPLDIEHTG